MTQDLNSRVALVTGASAGIGEACARELVGNGAKAVLNARREDRLCAIVQQINEVAGPETAVAAAGDCADPTVVESMFQASQDAFGASPDLVVVNAGRGLDGSILTSDPDQWEAMIRTNLLGAARLMRAAARSMLEATPPGDQWLDRPRDIIVLGSVVGRNVSPFSSAYGSTKFAVHGLAEGLRREIGPKGIRVTLIEPAFVVSEFQDVAGYDRDWVRTVFDKIGPVLEPTDIARTIAFVAAQPAHVHLSEVMIRPTRQDYP